MVAATVLFTLAYAALFLAANPPAAHRIVTDQNVTIASASEQLSVYWKLDRSAIGDAL